MDSHLKTLGDSWFFADVIIRLVGHNRRGDMFCRT